MANHYVEQRDGGYYITGTRISLDSVVYAYLRGESMLGIVESFPSLSLNQVTSAVDFYLANRAMVDELKNWSQVLILRCQKRPKSMRLCGVPSSGWRWNRAVS